MIVNTNLAEAPRPDKVSVTGFVFQVFNDLQPRKCPESTKVATPLFRGSNWWIGAQRNL